MVHSRPHDADGWGRLVRALMDKGDIDIQAPLWVASIKPQWAQENGAEALLWYWISDELARTTERYNPDFSRPESVAARAKAVDLLIDFSLRNPLGMRYWHWNSLGWAGARSGRYDLARGALERAEESMHAMPDEFPAGEFRYALVRLSRCWGRDGVGDLEESQGVFSRAAPLIEKHGEDWRSGFSYVWLADELLRFGDEAGAEAMIQAAQVRYAAQTDDNDMRAQWWSVVRVLRELQAPAERTLRAIDFVANEVQAHGEGQQVHWNSVGWEYAEMNQPEQAQDAWRRWLESQQHIVETRPGPIPFYNLACAHALVGDADSAVAALAMAIERGWRDEVTLRNDRDLASIRDDPRVQAMMNEAKED